MKKFVLISGAMGVGKTTVGKLLSDKLGRTAFIDGDWCIDIHPFIGNKETKSLAIDNIIHITKNFFNCSECDNIVLGWVMSENSICKIIAGLVDLNLQIYNITLVCNQEALIERWNNDRATEWRVDEWLEQSILSLEDYNNRSATIRIDTSNLSIDEVVIEIMKQLNV